MRTIYLPCLLLLIVLGCGKEEFSKDTITQLETDYQHCLDNEPCIICCTDNFYNQMDSCLNVVYQELRSRLPEKEKAQLKKEQLAWLKKRDREFDAIEKNNTMEGTDGGMIRIDDKAQFVKGRVLELIERLD